MLRPNQRLEEISRQFPKARKLLESLRAGKGTRVPDWPSWCYLPSDAAAVAAASSGVHPRAPGSRRPAVHLAALEAWRQTKGVYRVDPEVLEALWSTPLEGDLPADLFFRLPEWCVYVETPGRHFYDNPMHGVFVFLDWSSTFSCPELMLLPDGDGELGFHSFKLDRPSIRESIAAMLDRLTSNSGIGDDWPGARDRFKAFETRFVETVTPIVSVTLYLCSQSAEIRDSGGTGRRPGPRAPVLLQGRERSFAAERPTTWEVGYRLGAALRLAAAKEGVPAVAGTHASPRPHVRRAHWHTYLVGPKAGPQERVLKWLPPIAVKVDDPDTLVPVIRAVE